MNPPVVRTEATVAGGGVAQLVRALACHARGRGFESRHSRQTFHFWKEKNQRLSTFFTFLSLLCLILASMTGVGQEPGSDNIGIQVLRCRV